MVLFLVFSFSSPQFFTLSNQYTLIRQGSVLILVSLGMMLAIMSAGIDLSVGSLVGLTGACLAFFLQNGFGVLAAIILSVVLCACCGLITGIVIAKGRIYPFIVSFGMLFIAQGIGLGITRGGSIHIVNERLTDFGTGVFLGIPTVLWITVATVAAVSFVMKRTRFGVNTFAVGTDESAARAIGVKVELQKILVYLSSAVLAGIAGIVLASRIATGNAIIGSGMEFEAIAAVVIGGTPITGGRGSISGTVTGALIITILKNGLTHLGFPPEATSMVTGGAIMICVIIAQIIYRYQVLRHEA